MGIAGDAQNKNSSNTLKSAKPFSLAIGNHGPASNLKKRPHSALAGDSESEHEDETGPQLLTGFDRSSGKAITGDVFLHEQSPLVIAKQENRNWRAEAARRQGKNLLPAEEQARRAGDGGKDHAVQDEEDQPAYGLLIAQRSNDALITPVERTGERNNHHSKPMTADEEALEALLGKTQKPSLVIESIPAPGTAFNTRTNDEQTFKTDLESRPDVPSLADYAAVPIEEFGKALMRGMGWKDGEEIGRSKNTPNRLRDVKMRPSLLGIGAKEVPEGLEEIGAWGKGAKKSRKIDRSYMPLVMRNSRTGETLTEDELQKKRQSEKLLHDDLNDKSPTTSDAGVERRHRNRNNDDYRSTVSRERPSSHHREHRRSPGHRRRLSDADEVSDRYRNREKDRHREKDRYRDRHRDQGRDGKEYRSDHRTEHGRNYSNDGTHWKQRSDDYSSKERERTRSYRRSRVD